MSWTLCGLLLLSPPPQVPKVVDSILEAVRSRHGIPGLSVALALDGQVRYARGFGLADVENEVPATEETVYRLGSISKPISATLAMILFEEGHLDLDAPIQRYAPSFPPKPWPITSRELLGHLAGIRGYRVGELESTHHYSNLTDALGIFKDEPLPTPPGKEFLYSTYGYTLLGCAIEGASGRSFMEALREKVLEPAGMKTTRADDTFEIIPHRARGYERDVAGALRNAGLADTSYKIPGGGLCSTVGDVALFALAFEGGKLVKPETRLEMVKSQRTTAGVRTGYGLGWALDRSKGHREVFHGGGQQRVSTLLYLRPDSSFVVVLLANLEGVRPVLIAAARDIAEALGR